jgi:hypothetical protein
MCTTYNPTTLIYMYFATFREHIHRGVFKQEISSNIMTQVQGYTCILQPLEVQPFSEVFFFRDMLLEDSA